MNGPLIETLPRTFSTVTAIEFEQVVAPVPIVPFESVAILVKSEGTLE